MIGWVFMGLCLLLAVIIGGRQLLSTPPAVLARIFKYVILGLAVSAAIFFMVTARFGIGLGILIFLLPFLRRTFFSGLGNLFQFSGRGSARDQGKSSTVATDYLRMSLLHDSGEMDGEILQGVFQGRWLRDLSKDQQLSFYDTCLLEDPEAATLLEAYFDRAYGPGWRRDAGSASDSGGGSGRRRGWGKAENSNMTLEEARDILGVSATASTEEIKDAHRRLMMKNHPDQGGSDLLATKINQAKDLLLGN